MRFACHHNSFIPTEMLLFVWMLMNVCSHRVVLRKPATILRALTYALFQVVQLLQFSPKLPSLQLLVYMVLIGIQTPYSVKVSEPGHVTVIF